MLTKLFRQCHVHTGLKRTFTSIRPEFDGAASLLKLNTTANAIGTNNVDEIIKSCNDHSEYCVGRLPLIGICDGINSSYMTGPEQAPNIVRKAFLCSSGSFDAYFCNDNKFINTETAFIDCGNLLCNDDIETNHENISKLIENIDNINTTSSRTAGYFPHPLIILGGDHSITYSALCGLKQSEPVKREKIGVIHLDAHPDLYPGSFYNKYSNASVFNNLLESNTIHQLLQIGIRCMTKEQSQTLDKYKDKIQQLHMEQLFGYDIGGDYYQQIFETTNRWLSKCKENGISSFYVSIDIDVLEPCFAAGVSHVEPMGLSTKELFIGLDIVMKQLHCNKSSNMVIGYDIVEYNPVTDVNYQTAFVAAKLMRRIAANVIHLSESVPV